MPHFEDYSQFSLEDDGSLFMPKGCQTVQQVYTISTPTSAHWNPDTPSQKNSLMPDFGKQGFDASLSPRFSSVNVSPPASPSASPITRSPGPGESETTTIIVPNWRDDGKRRIFSCTGGSVLADPIFKDTMRKADKITRSGLDPEQSRVELSELMDFANDLVSHRKRQQEQNGTLEVNSKIPFFTLLPPHKDRGIEADFSKQDNIYISGYCPVAKKERDVISLKANLQELFPGREMFYGQSPNNSDDIYRDTRVMQDWEERAKGAIKRVDNKWVHPIRRRDCKFTIPIIPPTNASLVRGPSVVTSTAESFVDGEGK